MEALAAELARVRARVGVDQQVRGQRRRPLEGLAALSTLETALCAVNCPVLTETNRMSECLTTCTALVWPPTAAVCPPSVNLRTQNFI